MANEQGRNVDMGSQLDEPAEVTEAEFAHFLDEVERSQMASGAEAARAAVAFHQAAYDRHLQMQKLVGTEFVVESMQREIDRVRGYLTDGTEFDVPSPSALEMREVRTQTSVRTESGPISFEAP